MLCQWQLLWSSRICSILGIARCDCWVKARQRDLWKDRITGSDRRGEHQGIRGTTGVWSLCSSFVFSPQEQGCGLAWVLPGRPDWLTSAEMGARWEMGRRDENFLGIFAWILCTCRISCVLWRMLENEWTCLSNIRSLCSWRHFRWVPHSQSNLFNLLFEWQWTLS